MKKLITFLNSFIAVSLSATSLISCNNDRNKTANLSKLANTDFKKEVKNTNKKTDSKPESKVTVENKAISNNT